MKNKTPHIYTVRIINWEKWNSEGKTRDWFKLSTSFPFDPKVMALSNNEFRIYVSLLALAGRSKTDCCQFTGSSLTVGWRLRGSSLTDCLSKLAELQLVEIIEKRRKEEKREEKKKERKKENLSLIKKQAFKISDEVLERLYGNYPRKMGKTKAFEKLRKILNSEEAVQDFEKAVARFSELVKKQKTEQQFIPHFSTFVNSHWKDYLDEDVGQGSSSFDKEHYDRVMEAFGFDE